MTRTEQIRFVRDLTGQVKNSLLADIGRVPEEWDGHELRQWIADRFQESSYTLKTDKRRYREYRNAVTMRGL